MYLVSELIINKAELEIIEQKKDYSLLVLPLKKWKNLPDNAILL